MLLMRGSSLRTMCGYVVRDPATAGPPSGLLRLVGAVLRSGSYVNLPILSRKAQWASTASTAPPRHREDTSRCTTILSARTAASPATCPCGGTLTTRSATTAPLMASQSCDVPGCGRPHSARGYCGTHYKRWRRGGPVAGPIAPPREPVCSIRGCGRPHRARGLCYLHYNQARREQDPEGYAAYHAAYREQRRQLLRAKNQAYRATEEAKARKRESERAARAANPERSDWRSRNWRHRLRANGGAGVSHAEWRALLEEYGGCCAYCGGVATEQDHIVPVSRGGRHEVANIAPCCRSCNAAKGSRPTTEWLAEVL